MALYHNEVRELAPRTQHSEGTNQVIVLAPLCRFVIGSCTGPGPQNLPLSNMQHNHASGSHCLLPLFPHCSQNQTLGQSKSSCVKLQQSQMSIEHSTGVVHQRQHTRFGNCTEIPRNQNGSCNSLSLIPSMVHQSYNPEMDSQHLYPFDMASQQYQLEQLSDQSFKLQHQQGHYIYRSSSSPMVHHDHCSLPSFRELQHEASENHNLEAIEQIGQRLNELFVSAQPTSPFTGLPKEHQGHVVAQCQEHIQHNQQSYLPFHEQNVSDKSNEYPRNSPPPNANPQGPQSLASFPGMIVTENSLVMAERDPHQPYVQQGDITLYGQDMPGHETSHPNEYLSPKLLIADPEGLQASAFVYENIFSGEAPYPPPHFQQGMSCTCQAQSSTQQQYQVQQQRTQSASSSNPLEPAPSVGPTASSDDWNDYAAYLADHGYEGEWVETEMLGESRI